MIYLDNALLIDKNKINAMLLNSPRLLYYYIYFCLCLLFSPSVIQWVCLPYEYLENKVSNGILTILKNIFHRILNKHSLVYNTRPINSSLTKCKPYCSPDKVVVEVIVK